MANDKLCKLCKESIPKIALSFSNKVAIEHGYCCFMCMNSDLGGDKAYSLLSDKSRQGRQETSQERRSQHRDRW